MRRKLKKGVSLVLALVMLVTSTFALGLTAFADGLRDSRDKQPDTADQSSQTFTFADLAALLQKESVIDTHPSDGTHTNPAYVTSGNNMTVSDNQARDVMRAAEAFWQLAQPKIDPHFDKGGWALRELANEMNTAIQAVMTEEDYNNSNILAACQNFAIAGWKDCGKSATYTITVNAPGNTDGTYAYLQAFNQLADIPDEILTQVKYTYTVKNYARWSWQTSKGISVRTRAPVYDNTAKANLLAFAALWTDEVLASAYENLTQAQIVAINLDGAQTIAAVSAYPKEIRDRFLGTDAYEKAQALYQTVSSHAVSDYEALISDLTAIYGGDIVVPFELLPTMKTALDDTAAFYDGLTDEQKAAVADSKTQFNALLAKYEARHVEALWAEYDAGIAQLKTMLSDEFVATVDAAVMKDTLDGKITAAARQYQQSVRTMLTVDADTYRNPAAALARVLADLKTKMGEADYAAYRVEKVLGYFSGGAVEAGKTTTFAAYPNVLLYQYHDLDSLPETITYDKTTFSYAYDADGLFTDSASLTEATEQVTDTQAYKDFHAFYDFYKNRLATDGTDAELAQLYTDAVQANAHLEGYADDVCTNILHSVYVYAKTAFKNVQSELTGRYSNMCLDLYEGYYFKEELTREDVAAMESRVTGANILYQAFDEAMQKEYEDSKVLYDDIAQKYGAAVVKYKMEDFDATVAQIAERAKTPYIQTADSYSLHDNIAKDYQTTVDLFVTAFNLLGELYGTVNYTVADARQQILDGVKAILGEAYTETVDTALKALCGNISPGMINVFPAYLAQYHQIADIPEEIAYEYYVVDYKEYPLIKPRCANQTDKNAYADFNTYGALEQKLDQNLPGMTLTELTDLRTEVSGARNGVSKYSDEIRALLLGELEGRVDTFAAEIDAAIGTTYVSGVNAVYEKYGGADFAVTPEQSTDALREVLALDDHYKMIDETNLARADVVAAHERWQTMLEKLNPVYEQYNYDHFLACVELLAPYLETDGTARPITMQEITRVKFLLSQTSEAYGKLTDAQKQIQEIVDAHAKFVAVQAALDAAVGRPADHYVPSTVTYPSNMTAQDVETLLETLDTFLTGEDFAKLVGLEAPLKTFVMQMLEGQLYSDATVTAAVKAVYPLIMEQVGDQASTATLLKVYCLPSGVAGQIPSQYAEAKAALEAAGSDWNSVDWDAVSWNNISNREEFIQALGGGLNGLNSILKAMLANQKTSFSIFIELAAIKGDEGYELSVLPLLEQLGSTGLKTKAEFKKDTSTVGMLGSILNPLLDRIETLLDHPVLEIADLLPTLGYIVNYGMISDGLANLKLIGSGQAKAINVNFNDILSGMLDLSDMNALLNSLLASTGITLPAINWGQLAGHGTFGMTTSLRDSGTRVEITANRGDVGMAVLQYLVDVLRVNQDTLLGMLGASEGPVADLLTKLLANDTNEIIGGVYGALNAGEIADVDWSGFGSWTQSTIPYPEGLDAARMQQLVDAADPLISTLLEQLAGISLPEALAGGLYQDSLLNSLLPTVYGLLDGETLRPVLQLLGFDFSPAAVAALLADYPDAAAAVSTLTSWQDGLDTAWNVTDRTSFVNALTAALRPVRPLLGLLLNGEDFGLLGLVTVHGANGYANAILPLLQALGCEGLLSAADYQAAAANNADALLQNILNPLLDLAERAVASPVATLSAILPNFAHFMANGGLTKAVNAFLLPLTNLTDGVLPLVTEKDIVSFILELAGVDIPLDMSDIEGSLVPLLNSFLGDLTVGETQLHLALAPIDWTLLAGCGTQKDGLVTANAPDATLTVLRYVIKMLQSEPNASTVRDLAAGLAQGDATVSAIVDRLLTVDPDALIVVLANLLVPDGTIPDYDYDYPPIDKVDAVYRGNLTKADYEKAIGKLDEMIPQFLADTLKIAPLAQLVGDNLYTNAMVGTLVQTVYNALAGANLGVDVVGLLATIGVDVTPKGLAALLEADYPEAAQTLAAAQDWSAADLASVNWGFENGSRDGFINAVSAIFRPFNGLLGMILAGQNMTLLDAVTIQGGSGYNTAVIPLLEALGCKPESIKTYAEYQQGVGTDALIKDILTPVLELVDTICQKPVDTLTAILPNLAYFLNNNGLATAVDNLMAPVENLLQIIKPIYPVEIDLSFIKDFDIIALLNSLLQFEINGKMVSLTLMPVDFALLAARGTPQQVESKQIVIGAPAKTTRMAAEQPAMVTRIVADQPDVLVSVLRYVVNTLAMQENRGMLDALLGMLDPSSQQLAGLVLDTLLADPDYAIEMIFMFLRVTESPEEPDTPDIPDKPTTEPNEPGTTQRPSDGNNTNPQEPSADTGDTAFSSIVLICFTASALFLLTRKKREA